ncbi:MAG: acetyl-CoA acetyltransferase [Rhodocyclaceae bacterium]|nr:acetyl-CoA acetyltransferase [Rhodocyclaceae bacterium]
MAACIVGWGHSKFGRLDHEGLESLIVGVSRQAMADAAIEAAEVDGIWLANLNGGFVAETFCSSLVLQADDGLRWKPATRVENACASGAAAIFSALNAIEAGQCRIALVVGAEKMTAVSAEVATRVLSAASYVAEEASQGLTFPGIFAQMASGYFSRYGDHAATLAKIAAKNHANGVTNPWAHIRKDVGFDFCNTISDKNPLIAAPLRKTDCSLVSDGAAALVIVDASLLSRFKRAVQFRARSHISDFLPMSRRDAVSFAGPQRAWRSAYQQAGCSVNDLSFAEVHDCFTIAELLAYEAMGLAPSGEGRRVVDDGSVFADGRLPVNRSGGLKAKGHPIGATGVSMHVIAAMQLCGEAGAMQLAGPQLAGVFNMGGSAVANYVSILEAVR